MPGFFLQHYLGPLVVFSVQPVYLLVVAAHEEAVFGEVQLLAYFVLGELNVAGVAEVLDDGWTVGRVLLCGSAAFLSLDVLVHLLHVKEAIDLLDGVLHLALDPNEADRREISQAVVLLVEGTGDAEFLSDFVLLGGHLYSNVGLVDGVAVNVYLHFGLEEVAIGLITDRLCFNSILMLDLVYLQYFFKFFESYLILLAHSDLFLDKLHQFFLDEVFLEVLLL